MIGVLRYWTYSLCLFAGLFSLAGDAFGGILVLKGHYQERNIYVQNGLSATGVGFCTYEVRINDQVATDEVNTSAFEIDLSSFRLDYGTPVVIKIKYKDDGCSPVVLNPNDLRPNPTFETLDISVDRDGLLSWTTINEQVSMPFIIEQFKWNKWVKVGEIEGSGKNSRSHYTFQTSPITGINKFRVKQQGYIASTKYTKSVHYTATKAPITYVYNKSKKAVEFSEDTSFELYNKYGQIVKKGFGTKFDVSNLRKDVYYMNFDNMMAEFRRK